MPKQKLQRTLLRPLLWINQVKLKRIGAQIRQRIEEVKRSPCSLVVYNIVYIHHKRANSLYTLY